MSLTTLYQFWGIVGGISTSIGAVLFLLAKPFFWSRKRLMDRATSAEDSLRHAEVALTIRREENAALLAKVQMLIEQVHMSSDIAQQNAQKAQIAATSAQQEAIKVSDTLVKTTTMAHDQLTRIEETGATTHKIVNSQRTATLRALAILAKRVAGDNPTDEAAQIMAKQAAADLADAEKETTA